MFEATEILSQEHRIIERVLGALHGLTWEAREKQKLDEASARMDAFPVQ